MTVHDADPLHVDERLYRQIAKLLEDMESGGDLSLQQRIRKELEAKRATDATLRERIEDALAQVCPITTAERIRALAAIGRLQALFDVRRRNAGERNAAAGSAVRKYATAFKAPANAARGRAGRSRSSAIEAALADDPDDTDPDADDESAA